MHTLLTQHSTKQCCACTECDIVFLTMYMLTLQPVSISAAGYVCVRLYLFVQVYMSV